MITVIYNRKYVFGLFLFLAQSSLSDDSHKVVFCHVSEVILDITKG